MHWIIFYQIKAYILLFFFCTFIYVETFNAFMAIWGTIAWICPQRAVIPAGEQLGHPPGRWRWGMSAARRGLQQLRQRFLRAWPGLWEVGRAFGEIAGGMKGWLGKTSYLLFRQQRDMGKSCLLALAVPSGHASCVFFKDLCKWMLKFKKKKGWDKIIEVQLP